MDLLDLSIPDGYEIPFVLTLVVILVKIVLAGFLLAKIVRKRDEQNVFALNFIGSAFLFMVLAAISRVFYMVFDFFQTEFDEARYIEVPNIWFWKAGSLFSALGIIFIIWVLDKKILTNKLKGIPAYIMIVGILIQFLYPVNDFSDFEVITAIGMVKLVAFLIPILFFYIGARAPGLRKIAFAIAIGVIVYTVGGSIVSATLITVFKDTFGLATGAVYMISIGMKVAGLLAITYGAVHFKT